MTGADEFEVRLREALRSAASLVEESPDLFARVTRSIEEQDARRRYRRTIAARIVGFAALIAAAVTATSDIENGRIIMRWWILELLTTVVLIVIALLLGPFIKRFGKSYAGDVFRANPRTGKSYIVLTDVAYYLIFLAYTMFTITIELPRNWAEVVNAAQLKTEIARVAGILLIIGLLHSVNVVMLPMMGRLLSLNRRLDDDEDGATERTRRATTAHGAPTAPAGSSFATVPAGSWVLRIEPAPANAERPTTEWSSEGATDQPTTS